MRKEEFKNIWLKAFKWSFFSKIMLNQLKTVALLGALTGILLFVGGLIGGQQGLTIALFFAVLMNFGSYFFSHKIVLAMYHAKELKESEAPGIHAMVEEIAREAKIPKPKVYIIHAPHANAFATGPNPKKAVVAVTDGIVQLLTKEELKGVLAHEIGHVKNRDILISTIAATIASVISYLAFMVRWAAILGTGSRDDQRGSNVLGLLVMTIVAPLAAMIVQLAISRSREYLADERGARLIRNPLPLASALQKLESASHSRPLGMGSPSTAHLFIVKPFRGKGMLNLFSTHPPLHERVARLKKLKV